MPHSNRGALWLLQRPSTCMKAQGLNVSDAVGKLFLAATSHFTLAEGKSTVIKSNIIMVKQTNKQTNKNTAYQIRIKTRPRSDQI